MLKRRNAEIHALKVEKVHAEALLKEKDVRLTDQCESLMRLEDELTKFKKENADLRTEGRTQEKEKRDLKERVRMDADYLTQVEVELAEADQALGRMTRIHARVATSVTLSTKRVHSPHKGGYSTTL